MMTDSGRLGAHVVSRRVALGYRTRQALADASGVSTRTLGDIETGRRGNFDRSTMFALEHGLQWETGSVGRILDGGEPTVNGTAPELPADDAIELVLHSDLPEDVKHRFASILVEDRIAADRRRIDLARSLIEAVAGTA